MLDIILPNARKLHNTYHCAIPFPHMAITGLFEDNYLRGVAKEFPIETQAAWRTFDGDNVANKVSCNNRQLFGIRTNELVSFFQSREFLIWLSKLTGIRNLKNDKKLGGAGLHAIGRGGRLEIHADFNYSKRLKARRVINVLLYLNDKWEEHWGGHLELWNEGMTTCEKVISPTLNTMVVFSATSTSYHGHPHPLECPYGKYRKSLAMYYYQEVENIKVAHNTLYQVRREI